jgi:2-iminobutanoate/2-iminopropanoate deaminase
MVTPVGPYTPVVRAGDFLYVSGQIGIDAEGNLVDGLADQVRRAIGNLVGLLEQNSASLTNVVKTTVFLTDMSSYSEMNDIYSELFGDVRPARSAVAVAALPKAALVEIEAVAYVG